MTLTQLVTVLGILVPAANRVRDYTVAVDASGNATIALWNNVLGAQPTTAQLGAALLAVELQQAQQTQTQILEASYQTAVSQPVAYMGTSFLDDPAHQQLLSRAVQAYTLAGSVPTGFFVPDVNSSPVTMSLTQLQGLATAVAAQEWAAFSHWMTQQSAVKAATTVAEVQAVVW